MYSTLQSAATRECHNRSAVRTFLERKLQRQHSLGCCDQRNHHEQPEPCPLSSGRPKPLKTVRLRLLCFLGYTIPLIQSQYRSEITPIQELFVTHDSDGVQRPLVGRSRAHWGLHRIPCRRTHRPLSAQSESRTHYYTGSRPWVCGPGL